MIEIKCTPMNMKVMVMALKKAGSNGMVRKAERKVKHFNCVEMEFGQTHLAPTAPQLLCICGASFLGHRKTNKIISGHRKSWEGLGEKGWQAITMRGRRPTRKGQSTRETSLKRWPTRSTTQRVSCSVVL